MKTIIIIFTLLFSASISRAQDTIRHLYVEIEDGKPMIVWQKEFQGQHAISEMLAALQGRGTLLQTDTSASLLESYFLLPHSATVFQYNGFIASKASQPMMFAHGNLAGDVTIRTTSVGYIVIVRHIIGMLTQKVPSLGPAGTVVTMEFMGQGLNRKNHLSKYLKLHASRILDATFTKVFQF